MTMTTSRAALILAPAVLALSACGPQRAAGYSAALPATPSPSVDLALTPANGAIFSAASGYAPLHYGMRAHKIGDLVTITLTERIQTSKSTTSSTDRGGSFSITPPSVGPFSFNPGILSSGAGTSFDGSGDAAQTSSISGDITVTIAEVMPGGTVRIRGEKLMMLSQGEEWIQISGLLRLSDISSDNRVASTRIADARITYSGKGSVQRASSPGWLSQFFSVVSPF